jgi:spermidine synthase
MLKKVVSFLMPINIYQKKSSISKTLEVTWNNGQLVLDSKNTNYSFGSLQRILRKGLKEINFETIKDMDSILVLGVAGGSVIQTISKEIGFKGRITGVEIDAEIIEIANTYFKLDQIPNLEIVIDDAFEFVLKTKEKYDLIIIDVFQDSKMPHFLFEDFFSKRIGFLLNPSGYILFNTMIHNDMDNIRNKKYSDDFKKRNYSIKLIPRVEQHNELIVIQKKE